MRWVLLAMERHATGKKRVDFGVREKHRHGIIAA
jgi:hypothetical protein